MCFLTASDVRLQLGHVESGLHVGQYDFSEGALLPRTRQLRPGTFDLGPSRTQRQLSEVLEPARDTEFAVCHLLRSWCGSPRCWGLTSCSATCVNTTSNWTRASKTCWDSECVFPPPPPSAKHFHECEKAFSYQVISL